METLLPYIWDWFREKREYLKVFAAADSRVEGWFKAELLMLFTHLQESGVIERFECEVNIPLPIAGSSPKVDFKLSLSGEEHLCELKSPCISRVRGKARNLRFYFREDLIKDFRRLDKLGYPNRWVLAFVYPAPSVAEWNRAVGMLPNDLKHWKPITQVEDFPDWIYLALWRG